MNRPAHFCTGHDPASFVSPPAPSFLAPHPSSRQGYTLIELLAVMSIITLIMVAAVAGFMGTSRKSASRKAAEEIETAISLARQYAVAKNKPVLFLILDGDFNSRNGSLDYIESWGPTRGRHYAVFDPTNRTYVTGWRELPRGVVFDATYPNGSGGRNVLATDNDMFYNRNSASPAMIPFPGSADTNRLVTLPGVAFRTDGSVFVRGGDTTGSRRINVAEGSVDAQGTVTVLSGGSKYGVKISMLGNAVMEPN